jgi:benzodiazapine receptor
VLHRGLPSLAVWLLLTFAAAGVGALGSRDAPAFYAQLIRPAWAPSASLFGPVWTLLYCLIGVSGWLVWRTRRLEGGVFPYALFAVQLAANALWSWLFFEYRRGLWAFVEILVLDALIAATIVNFGRIKPLAAWLLVPYLAWVSFASALTLALWRLNPQLL